MFKCRNRYCYGSCVDLLCYLILGLDFLWIFCFLFFKRFFFRFLLSIPFSFFPSLPSHGFVCLFLCYWLVFYCFPRFM
ncbi:hypothetical protein BDZ91DRAFT_729533 [Kalaharituber pfeilii]|nr:hypothetical protein BDZ91DRAFT_729533 [Kalaharituber pfeilii]